MAFTRAKRRCGSSSARSCAEKINCSRGSFLVHSTFCQKFYEKGRRNETTEGTEKCSVDSKTYLIKSGTQEIGKFICLCEFLRSTFNPLCFLVFALNFGSGLSGLGLLQFIDGDASYLGWSKKQQREAQNNNVEDTQGRCKTAES